MTMPLPKHRQQHFVESRHSDIRRQYWSLLSSFLMILATVSLLLTGFSWVINGLNAVFTHLANGSTTVLLLLVWMNEKYSPQPLINHRLRLQTRELAAEWANILYSIWAWVAVILLALNFCLS